MSYISFRKGLEKYNRADAMRHQARMTEGPLTKNCMVRIIHAYCVLIELNLKTFVLFE